MKLSENGFSIIEVLLGVSVFALGMMGVLALLMSSVNSNAFSSRLSEADFLASSKLEELMFTDYDTATAAGGDLFDTDGDGGNAATNYGLHDDDTAADADHSEAATGKNGAFTVVWNNAPDQPEPNSTMVRVTVLWSEKGTPRSISITGVAKDGI